MLWRELEDRYGDYFEGGMGAEAIKKLIERSTWCREEPSCARDRPAEGQAAGPSASRRRSSA
jgi:DNA-directed RNA polymerase subunit beta'